MQLLILRLFAMAFQPSPLLLQFHSALKRLGIWCDMRVCHIYMSHLLDVDRSNQHHSCSPLTSCLLGVRQASPQRNYHYYTHHWSLMSVRPPTHSVDAQQTGLCSLFHSWFCGDDGPHPSRSETSGRMHWCSLKLNYRISWSV